MKKTNVKLNRYANGRESESPARNKYGKRFFTPHPSKSKILTPSPEGEGSCKHKRNEITDGTYQENTTVGHKRNDEKRLPCVKGADAVGG